ncbi:hypothetical protein M3Y99_01980100 [Aphelenchoides fujianensis]|nr:hypothetical protein M3Y99_01980100 [Aphelenchoides fujianensis]
MNGLLVILVFLSISATSAIDKVEFLMRNQALCGNLFSEAQWIPVLDICERECKEHEVCVENDELEQRCNKLPPACVDKWKQVNARPQVAGVENQRPTGNFRAAVRPPTL